MWLGLREKKRKSQQTDSPKCLLFTKLGLPAVFSAPPQGQALQAAPPQDQGAAGAAGGVCANVGCAGERAAAGPAQCAGSLKTRRPVEGTSKILRQTPGWGQPPYVKKPQTKADIPTGCRPQGPGLVSFRLHCLIQAADLV